MVKSHEDGVDDDAERDEQIDEGIHDEELNPGCEPLPCRTTLPTKEKMKALLLQVLLEVLRFVWDA